MPAVRNRPSGKSFLQGKSQKSFIAGDPMKGWRDENWFWAGWFVDLEGGVPTCWIAGDPRSRFTILVAPSVHRFQGLGRWRGP